MNKSILFLWTMAISQFSFKALALNMTLDPGHGGHDRGAIQGRLSEAELVLDIALQVQALLAKNSEIKSTLTRDSDKTLSLSERVEKAERTPSDLYVSVHANSNPSRLAEGAEFYFRENQSRSPLLLPPAKNENANEVEQIISDLKSQGQLRSSLLFSQHLKENWKETSENLHSAKIKRAPFYVVSHTSMPSVLIEVGFMTNPNELRKLNSKEHRQELAQKIYKSIVAYKESVDKSRSQSLE